MTIDVTRETALFTPTEAAVLTRLPVKAVHNAIDKKTIAASAGTRGGEGTRLLDLRALMSLALERRLAGRFVPELRREVFDALATAPRNTLSIEGGLLKIDLRGPRRELAASLSAAAKILPSIAVCASRFSMSDETPFWRYSWTTLGSRSRGATKSLRKL